MNHWLISDTHFSHKRMVTNGGVDGQLPPILNVYTGLPLRGRFASVEEMDAFMIQQWNKVVKPNDHVYHLGDVTIPRQRLSVVKLLNGKKRLSRGNHDIYPTKDYLDAGFEEIHGMRVLHDVVLQHGPLHPGSVGRFKGGHIHGHLHEKLIDDPRYLNVCVENIDYTPLAFEEARAILKKRMADADLRLA